MRVHFASILICLLCSTLEAEPIPVRSGEHNGFTRIVIHAHANSEWTAKRTGKLIEIELREAPESFDVSHVYSRITRDRIKSVEYSGGALLINTNCDCSASVFYSSPGMIVADIASPDIKLATPLIKDGIEGMGEANSTIRTKINARDSADLTLPNVLNKKFPETDTFQTMLTHDLAKLGALGVLRRNSSNILSDLTTPPLPKKIASRGNHEIHFSNAIIDSAIEKNTTSGKEQELLNCDASDTLDTLGKAIISGDLRNWYKDGIVIDPIKDADLIEVLQLLHNGFGAEAAQILTFLEGRETDISFLMTVAELLEYGSTDSSHGIYELLDCKPGLMIWKLSLSSNGALRLSEGDIKAALLSATELPEQLKLKIYPLLEGALRESDYLNSILTSPKTRGYVQNDASLTPGKEFKRESYRKEILRNSHFGSNSPVSYSDPVNSLLYSIDMTISEGKPATNQDMKVIDMEAFQLIGTEDEVHITELKLNALISRREFFNAYALLSSQDEPDRVIFERMTKSFFNGLLTFAEDLYFLEITIPIEVKFRQHLNNSLLEEITDRQTLILSSIGDSDLDPQNLEEAHSPRQRRRQPVLASSYSLPRPELNTQDHASSQNSVAAEDILANREAFRESLLEDMSRIRP